MSPRRTKTTAGLRRDGFPGFRIIAKAPLSSVEEDAAAKPKSSLGVFTTFPILVCHGFHC